MNRKNLDNIRYADLDEFILMEIVLKQYPDENKVLKDAYCVDGVTKTGLRVEGLFIDKQSGGDKACTTFIMNNWVNAKK